MSLQTTVNQYMAFGVPGDQYDSSPVRSAPFNLNSVSAAYNIIGSTCYTITGQGVAAAGQAGTAPFAGFLVNSKEYALYGTSAGGPLAPTLVLPNFLTASLITMGRFLASLPGSFDIGDNIIFNNTTGAISSQAPGVSLPGGSSWANAKVFYFGPDTGVGLAVLEFTQTNSIPTASP